MIHGQWQGKITFNFANQNQIPNNIFVVVVDTIMVWPNLYRPAKKRGDHYKSHQHE